MRADGRPRLRAIASAISSSLFVGLSLPGCSGGLPRDLQIFPGTGPRAIARLVPKDGSVAYGLVTFTQRGDKVALNAVVFAVGQGPHSLYIHETGNCGSPNAASAGRVWNAAGSANSGKRTGQLPELFGGTDGDATLSAQLRDVSVASGKPNDVVGHAVVVHDRVDPDPQPEFGARSGWIACGVIERG